MRTLDAGFDRWRRARGGELRCKGDRRCSAKLITQNVATIVSSRSRRRAVSITLLLRLCSTCSPFDSFCPLPSFARTSPTRSSRHRPRSKRLQLPRADVRPFRGQHDDQRGDGGRQRRRAHLRRSLRLSAVAAGGLGFAGSLTFIDSGVQALDGASLIHLATIDLEAEGQAFCVQGHRTAHARCIRSIGRRASCERSPSPRSRVNCLTR